MPGPLTRNYKRHGTTTPFAALEVVTGEGIGECVPGGRSSSASCAPPSTRITPKSHSRNFTAITPICAVFTEYPGRR